jgi:hypothetical protein
MPVDLDQLTKQTAFHSNPSSIANTPIYLEIVAQGKIVVPELIQALRDDHAAKYTIMMLLREITRADPTTARDVDDAVDQWIEWWAKEKDA